MGGRAGARGGRRGDPRPSVSTARCLSLHGASLFSLLLLSGKEGMRNSEYISQDECGRTAAIELTWHSLRSSSSFSSQSH